MKYIPTIGIETHVQLKTKTKLFAAVGNDASQAPPNSLISHICVGMPGALPVLNEAAIELCAKAAFALGTKPQSFNRFERKHYFYPDLPKGYQITQLEQPIILGGSVNIKVDGQSHKIGVERANLEEDAGKNIHPPGANYSLVDLNRAGTPLLEIVSQSDIHSPAQAKAYARELWLLMKYAGVTDGDLYHGHVRFDVNVSVSKDAHKKGTRSEVKNLNSFRSVESAVAHEIERQVERLEKGQAIVQETRGWDEAKQKTTSQRSKEEAEDYRYMPEPDVPPVELDDQYIARIKSQLPKMPDDWRQILNKLNISADNTEVLLDDPQSLQILEEFLTKNQNEAVIKTSANLLVNDHRMWLNQNNADSSKISFKNLSEVVEMLLAGSITRPQLKSLWDTIEKGGSPQELTAKKAPELYTKLAGDKLEKIVTEVLAANLKVVEDIKRGEIKAIGFLVGRVMKQSQGRANPELAQTLIKKLLKL